MVAPGKEIVAGAPPPESEGESPGHRVAGALPEADEARTLVRGADGAPTLVRGAVQGGEPTPSGLVGQIISGRYRVLELIATGGTSAVYLGQHVHMLKHVAIKVLDGHAERLPELVARFQREAIVGAHLHHPNVASASDFGQLVDGSYFLVLEHVRGVTLDQVIGRGPMPWERAALIGVQLAEALGAAHDAGIVHRDVKPRNVLFVEGPGTWVKLIDFGFAQVRLATLIGEEAAATEAAAPAQAKELTAAGMVLGTVAYMAPETALGMPAVDERSDLYALGIILYELLTGQHPFDAVGAVELFLQQCNQPPPLMAVRAPTVTIPPHLEALVMKLLAKDPRERCQRASEVVAALHAVLSPPNASLPSPPGTTASDAERGVAASSSRWRSALTRHLPAGWPLPLAGGAVLLLALAAWSLGRSTRTAPADGGTARRDIEVAPAATPPSPPELGTTAGPPGEPASAVAEAPASSEGATRSDAPPAREVLLELAGLDAWGWRMSLRKAARERDWPKGAEAVRALLRLDPPALREVDLQVAARAVTVGLEQVGGERSTQFFAALTNDFGSAGIDLLYDVAKNRPTSKAGRWATEILRLPAVMARASAAVRVLFEFRESSCTAKRDLFGRMTEHGDERALLELRALRDAECPRRRDPCCYRDNSALSSAIATLGRRLDTPPLK